MVTNGVGGGKKRGKGERKDEGYNNKITRSLRSIVCTSLWCCWSSMCGMGGGMTKEEGLGQRAQRWGKPKKKPLCLKMIRLNQQRLACGQSGQPKGVVWDWELGFFLQVLGV